MAWPQKVALLGVGTMGHGIAQQFAVYGREVALWDANPAARERAPQAVADNLAVAVGAGALAPSLAEAAPSRLRVAATLSDAVSDADLVVEAIAEDLEAKQAVFAEAEQHAEAQAVLATNTSAIDIDAIARACIDPSRVLGTHWFNPPHIVPGVEVIPGAATRADVVALVVEGLRSIGRVPSVTRNTAGFVANRIQFAMIAEAFRCLDEGVADAETIDAIVRTTFGPRLAGFGLFEIADLAGLDVYANVLAYLEEELRQPAFAPSPSLREAVNEGRLGVKAGRGMYDYGSDASERLSARDRTLYGVFAAKGPGA